MKLFDWLTSTLSSFRNQAEPTRHNVPSFGDDIHNRINPASSLPMNGSVDIHGNSFGSANSISHDPFSDIHRHHSFDNSIHSCNDYQHHHYDPFQNSFSQHDYHDPFRNY